MKRVALVLAAGSGSRFGSDKLSAPFRGEPLVHHAIRAALKAPAERAIVVAHPALDLSAFNNIEIVRLTSTALSDSLREGLDAAGYVDALFVFLGDMPLVPHDIAAQLVEQIGSAYAAMPRHGDKLGHPVLLSHAAFADLRLLEGDAGLGKLLRTSKDVVHVDCPSPHIHTDVDKLETLITLERETQTLR